MPSRRARIRQTMEPWAVKSHPVATADQDATVDIVYVQDSAGVYYSWARSSTTQDFDLYSEEDAHHESQFWDNQIDAGDHDGVYAEAGSPSRPTGDLNIIAAGLGDDGFIDVDIYVP